ncbi:Chaperone protein DnaJ [Enterococcus sp. HSIEG1]|nr:Chaperone protein DnaJ [Enterococcus sp. HSIEG1]
MRLSGQGEAGSNGGPYGDLYVVFRVEESDIFDRDGSEIYYELPLNFVQAALGDEVNVPTVHGNVKLKIPAGTQTGTNFRLRGKGAPKLRGNGNGDQQVKVKLITPKNLNEEQKEALRAYAKASGHVTNEQQPEGFFDKMKDAFGGKKNKKRSLKKTTFSGCAFTSVCENFNNVGNWYKKLKVGEFMEKYLLVRSATFKEKTY